MHVVTPSPATAYLVSSSPSLPRIAVACVCNGSHYITIYNVDNHQTPAEDPILGAPPFRLSQIASHHLDARVLHLIIADTRLIACLVNGDVVCVELSESSFGDDSDWFCLKRQGMSRIRHVSVSSGIISICDCSGGLQLFSFSENSGHLDPISVPDLAPFLTDLDSPVSAFELSPTSRLSNGCGLCVTESGAAYIVDFTNGEMAITPLSGVQIQPGPVVVWSRYIPSLLACAAQDGVRLIDARLVRRLAQVDGWAPPAAVLSGIVQPLFQVAFSPAVSDLLWALGADGQVAAYVFGSHFLRTSPLVSAVPSSTRDARHIDASQGFYGEDDIRSLQIDRLEHPRVVSMAPLALGRMCVALGETGELFVISIPRKAMELSAPGASCLQCDGDIHLTGASCVAEGPSRWARISLSGDMSSLSVLDPALSRSAVPPRQQSTVHSRVGSTIPSLRDRPMQHHMRASSLASQIYHHEESSALSISSQSELREQASADSQTLRRILFEVYRRNLPDAFEMFVKLVPSSLVAGADAVQMLSNLSAMTSGRSESTATDESILKQVTDSVISIPPQTPSCSIVPLTPHHQLVSAMIEATIAFASAVSHSGSLSPSSSHSSLSETFVRMIDMRSRYIRSAPDRGITRGLDASLGTLICRSFSSKPRFGSGLASLLAATPLSSSEIAPSVLALLSPWSADTIESEVIEQVVQIIARAVPLAVLDVLPSRLSEITSAVRQMDAELAVASSPDMLSDSDDYDETSVSDLDLGDSDGDGSCSDRQCLIQRTLSLAAQVYKLVQSTSLVWERRVASVGTGRRVGLDHSGKTVLDELRQRGVLDDQVTAALQFLTISENSTQSPLHTVLSHSRATPSSSRPRSVLSKMGDTGGSHLAWLTDPISSFSQVACVCSSLPVFVASIVLFVSSGDLATPALMAGEMVAPSSVASQASHYVSDSCVELARQIIHKILWPAALSRINILSTTQRPNEPPITIRSCCRALLGFAAVARYTGGCSLSPQGLQEAVGKLDMLTVMIDELLRNGVVSRSNEWVILSNTVESLNSLRSRSVSTELERSLTSAEGVLERALRQCVEPHHPLGF